MRKAFSLRRDVAGAGFLLVGTFLLGGCFELNAPSANAKGEIALALRRDGSYELISSKPTSIYVTDARGSFLREVANIPLTHAFISWSPDGSRLLYTASVPGDDKSRVLKTVKASGSDSRTLVVADKNIWMPQWSPAGESVLYGLEGRLRLADVGGGNDRALTQDGGYGYFTWGPDEKAVYAVKTGVQSLDEGLAWPNGIRPASLSRISLEDGEVAALAIGLFPSFGFLAVSPGTKNLFFAAYASPLVRNERDRLRDQSLVRLDLSTGSLHTEVREEVALGLPKASPDGATVLYIRASPEEAKNALVLLRLGSGRPRVLAGGKNIVYAFWISPVEVGYVEQLEDQPDRITVLSLADGAEIDLTARLKSFFTRR